MIYLLLETEVDFTGKARAVFRHIFQVLGCAVKDIRADDLSGIHSGLVVYYGNGQVHPHESVFLIQIAACHVRQSLADLNQESIRHAVINRTSPYAADMPSPVLYFFSRELAPLKHVLYSDRQLDTAVISHDDRAIRCATDIIATIFYFLNMEDEKRSPHRDVFHRFHKAYGLLGDEVYETPLVDRAISLMDRFFRLAAGKAGLNFDRQERWPSGHQCALALSHDVDRLRTWTFRKVKRAFMQTMPESNLQRKIRTPFRLFSSLSRNDNWQGNFEYILDLEKRYGAHSTFFFVSQKRHDADPSYSLKSRRIQTGMRRICDEGFHIGLHGSIPSARNRDMLGAEKQKITEACGCAVQGLRFHYLCFDAGETFNAVESNDFMYDSTLGFAGETGYRCGTGLPFFPFHQETSHCHSFLEIPLVLMDTVLFLESKCSLTALQAGEVISDYLEEIRLNHSCITINWHNNNVSPGDLTGYTELYKKILQWGYEHNAWMCSMDELAQWWMRRRS